MNGKGDKWRPTDMDKYRNSSLWDNLGKKIEEKDNVIGENYHGCTCHKCIKENQVKLVDGSPFLLSSQQMILCPECGNKRCPHASDHDLDCTNSNEPGQKGSIFE